MPLKKVISANIEKEIAAGRSQKQAVAIAMAAAGRSRPTKAASKKPRKGSTKK